MAKAAAKDYKFIKRALDSGDIQRLYIFSGEESFLKSYCLDTMKDRLLEGGCDVFNLHELNGPAVDMDGLSNAIDTYPMMSGHSLTVVTDFDIFGQNEGVRERLISIISDLPDYACVVFYYDTIEYKSDGRLKKLSAAIDQYATWVSFDRQSVSELTAWTVKRFSSLNREISRGDAQYLVEQTDGLMTSIGQEIEKLAAFCSGTVTRADIDELVEPTVEAVVFDMTNAIADQKYGEALIRLRRLYEKKEEPITLLSVLGGQLRQLYTARLALAKGKDAAYLQKLWGLSPYAVKLRIAAAKRFSDTWCRRALTLCAETDQKMKSTGYDKQLQLEMLILELSKK